MTVCGEMSLKLIIFMRIPLKLPYGGKTYKRFALKNRVDGGPSLIFVEKYVKKMRFNYGGTIGWELGC